MSNAWDPYVQNMKKCGLQICGIFGLDGSAWAQAPELKATPQEVSAVVSGIKSNNVPSFHLGGMKYTTIRADSDTATGKCRGAAKETENYLAHCALGKTCIVIGGMCGASERDTTKHVEDIRDYLVKAGY